MRSSEIFIPIHGQSMNALLGHPKGAQVYRGLKKKIGEQMIFAGLKRKVHPFVNPVTLSYFPKVCAGPTGRIRKDFDSLNFAVTYKIMEDKLVKFGILKDDRREFVRGSFCHSPEVVERVEDSGILLVIQEVDTVAQQSALL
jgi:hypothetical protein